MPWKILSPSPSSPKKKETNPNATMPLGRLQILVVHTGSSISSGVSSSGVSVDSVGSGGMRMMPFHGN